NNWLRIAIGGVKNLKLAPGATVEVKTGASYQKKIYQGVPLLFGLAGYKEVDTVRITWPNGLIQNEPKQPILTALNFKEAQRLSGSCPMIFTWNGKRFEFVTDVLGVAPLGASSGDGQYFPVAHQEYVQIPGESLVERAGAYEIRVTEELREVSYLDRVQLIALDHPSGTEIFTNEKFKSPPFPDFLLYGAERRIYPSCARDSASHDVLARLLKRDRTYPDSFRRDYNGVAELHHLDLDFGSVARDGPAALILNGWVDWADGSTFLRAAQESKNGLVFPYLQVKNSQGEWQTVIDDMGIPAGKPKTIAVDDRLVIMGSGDELRLLFPARNLPAIKPGWKRDFLLLVDGWAKDGDYNTAFSQTVEPLPFRAMTSYPYPASQKFPDDEAHRAYLERYNTRPALRLVRPLVAGASGNGK